MYNQKEEDKARTPFQSWDDILKRIHHKSRCEPRMLSDDLQVDFSVVLHHKHPSKPSPARFSLQVSAINVSTARSIGHTIRRFREMALDTIDYDILDAPFYLICKEEPEDKKFVVAKHGMQVVWEWFERNVRLGDAKFFVNGGTDEVLPGEAQTIRRRDDCAKARAGTDGPSEEQSDRRMR